MNIASYQAIAHSAQAAQAGEAAEKTTDADEARASASADYDTFLTLLTAQVRHQDPLEPIDSTQFVEQLATFSALEQQIEANEHLAEIGKLIADATGATEAEPAEGDQSA